MRAKVKAGVAAQRAIEILEVIAQARRPIAGTEIMETVRLPKPTVYRTCTLLEEMGLVQREPHGKKLTVGPRLCALGLSAMSSSPLRAPIRAILHALSRAIGETCTFTVLDGAEAVCVDRVESAKPLRMELQAGSRIPLHCTASGKLFLSMMPRAQLVKLIRCAPLERFTVQTVVDPDVLELELRRTRKERVGRDNEGYCPDLVAIAVPVCNTRGDICGTLSVNAPAARMTLPQAEFHLPLLRRAAESVAEILQE